MPELLYWHPQMSSVTAPPLPPCQLEWQMLLFPAFFPLSRISIKTFFQISAHSASDAQADG